MTTAPSKPGVISRFQSIDDTPGEPNGFMADGAVKFITSSTDVRVYQALGSKASKDIATVN